VSCGLFGAVRRREPHQGSGGITAWSKAFAWSQAEPLGLGTLAGGVGDGRAAAPSTSLVQRQQFIDEPPEAGPGRRDPDGPGLRLGASIGPSWRERSPTHPVQAMGDG